MHNSSFDGRLPDLEATIFQNLKRLMIFSENINLELRATIIYHLNAITYIEFFPCWTGTGERGTKKMFVITIKKLSSGFHKNHVIANSDYDLA